MKIKKKPQTRIDFDKVILSETDDEMLEDMKSVLEVFHRHAKNKLEKGSLKEDQIPHLAKTYESYTRICTEQRKRAMIRAMQHK